jgi:hypothetical protein
MNNTDLAKKDDASTMGDKKRTICDWKDVEKKLKQLRKVVEEPKYACRKCGRVANDKAYLCKPISLDD